MELPPGAMDAARRRRDRGAVPRRPREALRLQLPRRRSGCRRGPPRSRVGQPEGRRRRHDRTSDPAAHGQLATATPSAPDGTRPVGFGGGHVECPVYDRARLRPGDRLAGPAVVEEFGATTVVFPGQHVERRSVRQPDPDPRGRRPRIRADAGAVATVRPRASGAGVQPDPIVLQIVEGTLASVEAEVEAAIERTARSPMIREARDFRAGIHDRRCRKLTGRSYSSLVQPVVRDFPARDDAARGRLLPQRRVRVGGRDRPPARPLRDVPVFHERSGGGVRPGLRPSR